MAAKTPTSVTKESAGENMLYTYVFSDIDDTDTYTDSYLTDAVGYWANATDSVGGDADSGAAINVAYTQATGVFTFYTGEANRVVNLFILRKQV